MNLTVQQAPLALEERRVTLPTGELAVRVQAGHFALDTLMGFAARANAKRGFLFLSKVLGKHWPVRPDLMAEIHGCLARQIPADLPGPVVFIALAETGVGLGQGVFESWLAQQSQVPVQDHQHQQKQALFLHTSRYRIGDGPLIEFAEAHSHAPRQFLHMPAQEDLRQILLTARSLVLVDDEASTGNTFLNLVEACRTLNPDISRVHLATITNFMGHDVSQELSARFGLEVSTGSALDGDYVFAAGSLQPEAAPAQRYNPLANSGASAGFGRRGLDRKVAAPLAQAAEIAAGIHAGAPVLVLGTGEFMHPAFLLGQALAAHGLDVMVQSTTRSPILEWGAVSHVRQFADNYGEGIPNFLYNVAPGQYAHVLICHETPVNPALLQLAASLDARLIHFQSEGTIEQVPVC